MKAPKTVGIKDLKNNLSAYIREVRQGVRIFVSDRDQVVAELREPGARYEVEASFDPIVVAWARKGLVRMPTRPREPLPPSQFRSPRGTAKKILDEIRAEGRR